MTDRTTELELMRLRMTVREMRKVLQEAADVIERWDDPNTDEPHPVRVKIAKLLKRP